MTDRIKGKTMDTKTTGVIWWKLHRIGRWVESSLHNSRLSIVFIPLMLLTFQVYANVYTQEVDGVEWVYSVKNGKAVLGGEAYPVVPSTTVGSLTIPSSLGEYNVGSIEYGAFYGCRSLTHISIPACVTKIDMADFAFSSCTGLKSFSVDSNNSYFTTIGGLLYDKSKESLVCCPGGLSSVVIPSGTKIVGHSAFCGNIISDVTFPSGIETISHYAFSGCGNLREISLPDSVSFIGQGAFNGCALESIRIPKGLEYIGEWPFKGCKFSMFYVPDDSENFAEINGLLCNKQGTTLVMCAPAVRNVIVPNGISIIRDDAFIYCTMLESAELPTSIEVIGNYAFYWCTALKKITIPENTRIIGSYGYSFYGCLNLEKIVFQGLPPSIGSSVFSGLKSGAIGTYTLQHKVEWDAVIDANGFWNGLKMRLGASIEVLPTEMDWVNKELTIGWTWSANEDNAATPPASYSIYYSDNTNTYDTANVVVEGLSGLLRSYKDSEYLNRLDGLKPVCYFVVGSDGSVGVCQTRNRHGIFVGLNEWENPNLESIGGDKNANDLYNLALLQGEFQDSNISLLLNSNATIINVNVAFEKVKAEALPGDVCLFYFSTHGGIDTGKTACLCMYNGYYTDQMLAKKIADIDSGVAIVGIVSACHSGGLYDTDPSWDEWYVKNNLAQCTPNIAWLSSSGVANTAYGVFDEFLLKYGWEKGWAGPDEMISFNDLATYTKEQYDTLFSGTILKGEKKSKTAQIEDPGELLASIVAGRRGDHETGIRKPSVPNNVDVKTGLYLDQLDVTLKPVADADEYCIFLLSEDGCYEKIWTPSAERLQTVDLEHSSVLLSNKRFSDTSLQVLVKAVNGAGVSQAVTSERKELVRITFDGNGGEVGNWRGAEAFEVSTGHFVVFGDVSVGSELLTLPSAGTYSVVGYEFKGWFDENGTEATPETEVSQSTVYYARWESSATEPEFNVDENGVLVGIDYGGATEITLPDTVTSIAGGAFGYNSELIRVTIPASVNSIHAYAFDNCSGLISITVAEDNPFYKSINGLLVTKDGKTLVQGVNGDVKIPLGVTAIGDSAFYGCDGLTSVEIPESVTIIDEYAFGGCFSLTDVTIPANVEYIGDDAFSDCTALDYVEFVGIQDAIDMDVTKAFYGTPWLISLLPTPENDDYSAAVLLSGDSGRITGTNIGASSETIESGLGLGNATIWWKWQAQGSYTVEFDTLGSGFDTILGVYVESENGLAEIAYSDDCDESNEYESLATFNAIEGYIYHIVVSGNESNMGTVVLNWSPQTDTPIPIVTQDSEIATALSGSADTNLTIKILDVEQYNAYRGWATALNVNNVSTLAVKRSPNAWLAFALGADTLIWEELASGDVKIESFTPTPTDGKFEFSVSVKNVNIGGGSVSETILKENLKKVLGIEGAKSLSAGAFSSNNIDITFDTPVDGKAKFTVSPPADAGNSFFMRVKVK